MELEIEPRRFLPLLGATGLVVVVHQLADLALLLPGIDFATPAGRVRALLAVEARTPAAIAADVLLLWAIVGGWSQGAIRWVGVLHWILGALMVLAIPLFLTDAGQVARGFSGSEAVGFRLVVARTLVVLPVLGIGAVLAGRALNLLSREHRPPPATPA